MVLASGSEWALGAGSVPWACPGAHRLTGLEGRQVGTKVWLLLDGATGEGHLTRRSPQAWWHILEVACSTTRGGCFIKEHKNRKIIYLSSSKGLPVACGATQLTRNPWFTRNITAIAKNTF